MPVNKDALFWVDLEMTGLDPETCTILEIAAIVTDSELNVLDTGPSIVIHQTQDVLEKMDSWNQEHHRKSGLYDAVLASTVSLPEAEQQVLDFAKAWLMARKAPLCGNSIWQDRRFLCKYMPRLEAHLHYRIIDVSSFKECVRRWYPKGPEMVRKKETHRALDDIQESINELKFYRQHYWRALAEVPVVEKGMANEETKF
jgi:oligoribonuclease